MPGKKSVYAGCPFGGYFSSIFVYTAMGEKNG